MSYYRECPYCHAHLDAGERCDCGEGGLLWHDEQPAAQEAQQPPGAFAGVDLGAGADFTAVTMPDNQTLQRAYMAHMERPGSKRLPWMEAAIDKAME